MPSFHVATIVHSLLLCIDAIMPCLCVLHYCFQFFDTCYFALMLCCSFMLCVVIVSILPFLFIVYITPFFFHFANQGLKLILGILFHYLQGKVFSSHFSSLFICYFFVYYVFFVYLCLFFLLFHIFVLLFLKVVFGSMFDF